MTLTISLSKLAEYRKSVAAFASAVTTLALAFWGPSDPKYLAIAPILAWVGVTAVPNEKPKEGFGPNGEPK